MANIVAANRKIIGTRKKFFLSWINLEILEIAVSAYPNFPPKASGGFLKPWSLPIFKNFAFLWLKISSPDKFLKLSRLFNIDF